MILYQVFAGVDFFVGVSSNKHGQILPQLSFLENREETGGHYCMKKNMDLISPNCGSFIGELVQLSEPQFPQLQNKGNKLYFFSSKVCVNNSTLQM